MQTKNLIKIILLLLSMSLLFNCVTTEKQEIIHAINKSEDIWKLIENNDYKGATSYIEREYNQESHISSTYMSDLLRAEGISHYGASYDFKTFDIFHRSIKQNPYSIYNPVVVNFMINELIYDINQMQSLADTLESYVLRDDIPNWMKREFYFNLNTYYRYQIGNIERADSIKASLNSIYGWKIIGPYPNVSGSGFKNDYIQIDGENGLTENNRGINNWEILSFKPRIINRELHYPISNHFASENYISIYAYKEIKVEEEQLYEFVLSRSGSIEVWINDQKYVEEGSNTGGENSHYFTVELKKGTNRILVKSNKRETPTAFNLSYYRVENSEERDSETYDYQIQELKDLNNKTNNMESQFWLTYSLLKKGKVDEVRTLLNNLNSDNSDLYNYFKSLLLLIEGDFPLYNRSLLNLAEKKTSFKPVIKRAGEIYLYEKRDYELNDMIRGLKKEKPEWSITHLLEFSLELYRQNHREIKELYNKNSLKYPYIPHFDELMLVNNSIYTTQEKLQYISNLFNTGKFYLGVMLNLSHQMQYGTYSTAKIAADRATTLYPLAEEHWIDYANLTLFSENITTETKRSIANRLLYTFPTSLELLSIVKNMSSNHYSSMKYYKDNNPDVFNRTSLQINNFLQEMEVQKELYTSTLEKLLQYYPYNINVRDELRELQDKKKILEEVTSKDTYDLIKTYEKSDFDSSGSDIVVVYDKKKEIFFGDGASSEFRHLILKLNTATGIENNRFVRLNFNPYNKMNSFLYESYTLKQDGTRIEADYSGREVAFNRISTGDYIVLRYRVDYYSDGLLNNKIFRRYNLSDEDPIFEKYREIIYPKEMNINFKYNNTTEDQVDRETGTFLDEFNHITLKTIEKPYSDYYYFSPTDRDIHPNIEISSINSWQEIIDWYEPIYRGQTIPSHTIKEKATELTAGLYDRNEKIMALYNFVTNKIEYEDLSFQYDGYIPQTADSVLKEGYGDCKDQSILLISLLESVGIEAYITLNYTKYKGDHEFIPSEIFDHVIVGIDSNGETLYLDPTLTYYTFGEMPVSRDGTYLLDVKEGGTFHRADYNIDLQKSMSLLEFTNITSETEIKGTMIQQGSDAWNIRQMMKDLGDGQQEKIFETHINGLIPSFHLAELELENIDEIIYDPIVKFSGTTKSIFTEVDNSTIKLELPWVDYLENSAYFWLGADSSVDIIQIPDNPLSSPKSQLMIIEIPKGYKVKKLPQDTLIQYEESYMRYKFIISGNKIILEREFYIPEQMIERSKLTEFKNFLDQGVTYSNRDIYLAR